ncbi:MAG: replication-relaxation family protein [Actinomycetia bacterium]|nr:replication-relaxation family protein [Actinomycetes bacterium]
MKSIELYRYLTASQIEDLHFHDHTSPLTGARTCRRVLERLSETGVIFRLERRVGGIRAGSASYIYGLGSVGQRVLHQGDAARVRRREPSLTFIDHTLAISQLAVDLTVISRQDLVDLLELTPEPGCWRSFQQSLEGSVTLRPDLAVAVRAAGYQYHWFVEVDLGTHSSASVARKCRVYQDYWCSGVEQDTHGLFPKVLWVTPTVRRAEQLGRAISAAHGLYENLFDVTTTDEVVCHMVGVKP